MKTFFTILFYLLALQLVAQNNIGIGTIAPHTSAVLDVSSTNRGLLPPRMSAAQRNAIASPANGLIVFDTDSAALMLRSAGGWQKLSSTASGDLWRTNGNNIFNGNTGNVGVGISNPVGKLEVNTGDVLFRGYSLNYPQVPAPTPTSGGGGRMMWYADKAAFRVGHTGAGSYFFPDAQTFIGTEGQPNVWDRDSIGQYSFAAGASTLAKGLGSVSLGYINKATGYFSTALGYNTQAIGRASTSLGDGTIANANGSMAIGTLNDTADNSIFNSVKPTDRVFQIGNGFMTFGGPVRSTSFSILRNGNVGIGVPNPNVPLHFATQLGKKISLYRGASGDAGFGVWGSELRLHSDFNGAAITFGYDDLTNGFTERFRMAASGDLRFASDQQSIQFVSSTNTSNAPMMRMFESGAQNPSRMVLAHSRAFPTWGLEYKDTSDQFNFKGSGLAKVSIQLASGFVGINDSLPNYHLDVKGRIRLQGLGNESFSAGIWYSRISDKRESFFTGVRNDSSWGIYSNNTNTPGWRFNMNDRTGYIGLGSFNANAPLHFNNDVQNRKIILYENANNDHQYYGFGINSGALRYQTDAINADHVFYAAIDGNSSNELMRLKGNGAVGFNTDDPNVYGHGGANQFVEIRNRLSGNNAQSHLILSTSGTAGSMGGITWSTRDFVGEKRAAFIGAAYETGTNDALFQVQLRNNGSLAQRFRVNSNGNAWLQGTLTQNSDARLKKDIVPLSNSLEAIQQLSGYSYHWKDASNPEEQIGLLAQEVQKVYPQLVKENEQGTLSVNYSGMVPVLLEVVKELQNQITIQQTQYDLQKAELAELKKLVNQILKK